MKHLEVLSVCKHMRSFGNFDAENENDDIAGSSTAANAVHGRWLQGCSLALQREHVAKALSTPLECFSNVPALTNGPGLGEGRSLPSEHVA